MSTDTSIAFLSYCRADSDFALKLAGDLKSAGARLWMDQLDIQPGTPWDRAVQDALASAPCVLVILSTASVASENVGDEVSFALSKQKRIIPVLYRDCDVPLRLARLQHIDFRTDYAGGLQALVKALGAAPDPRPKPGAAGPLPSSVQPTLQKDTGASHRVTAENDEFPAVVTVREPRALDQVVAKDSTLPLSAMNYAVIAAAGLIIAVGFTLFYIYQVPKLVANGSQGQIFYLLLIPWALSCAAFLFGAMKSYARFTYKHLGNFLELGGPVILFCLVLVGGFRLVPPEPETFDLTVRAHSADQHDPIITSGKITIDLDNDRRTAVLGASGEAEYKGIPAKFKGASLKVLPQVDGYDQQWQEHQIAGNVLDLALVRAALPVTILTGTISPPPGKGKSVRIFVEGQKSETSADDLGRFELSVNGKPGDRVVVKVYVDGKQVYDDFEVLPGPVTLSLHKPDTARREAPHGSSSATPVQSPITQGPGSALSINQQGGITAGTINVDTHPHLVMTDTQREAVRDAMTPFVGKRAFVLINGATKELVEFGTTLNAALAAAGVNSEVKTGMAFPVGAAPQLALFVGFKSGTADMAQTLMNAVVKNRILPGSEIGYHQYGDESQDPIQIVVSPLI